MVARRWLQILTDGQEIHLCGPQIIHDLKNLGAVFAHTSHQPGFREYRRGQFLDAVKDVEGAEIARTRPNSGIKARDRFDVVVENVRAGGRNLLQRVIGAIQEIRG